MPSLKRLYQVRCDILTILGWTVDFMSAVFLILFLVFYLPMNIIVY